MTKNQTSEHNRKSSHSSIDRAINSKMATAHDRKNILFKNLPIIPPVETWIGHQFKGQTISPAERKYLIDDDPDYPKALKDCMFLRKETAPSPEFLFQCTCRPRLFKGHMKNTPSRHCTNTQGRYGKLLLAQDVSYGI